jgi:hypothetical protein
MNHQDTKNTKGVVFRWIEGNLCSAVEFIPRGGRRPTNCSPTNRAARVSKR